MVYRVENKICGDVFYVKCSSFCFGTDTIKAIETDCLSVSKLDENKWPYNVVEPDIVVKKDLKSWLIRNFYS